MIDPRRAATFLIGAMMFAAVGYVAVTPAIAEPVAAPDSAPAARPKTTRAPSSVVRTRSATAAIAQPLAPLPPPFQPIPAKPRGRAYLFRGAMGPIFSRGMDRLTDRIEQAGIPATVNEFTICQLIARKAIREYRDDPVPIVLIGHSMGGLCAVKFAEILQDENIPVSLIVAIDPAQATDDVPANVERFINIFLSTNILGGGDVKPLPGYPGHYASFDLAKHDEVTHINIDKMDYIHDQVVSKILQLSTTPAKSGGETLPIRYIVPPGVDTDLWDSGMPVLARPGDTLQSLAAFYRVPLWSLTQINKLSDSSVLAPGQRLVVPRHLMPYVAVSGQVPATLPARH